MHKHGSAHPTFPETNHGPDDGARERKLKSLLELGRIISLDLELDEMLLQIAHKASEVMEADRFSLFLYDPATDELYTTVALGLDEHQQIRIPAYSGIAGHCFKTGELLNLKDAYSDPRFNREVDTSLGYHTQTLLSMPFYNREGHPLGAVQVLNKRNGFFTEEDERFLATLNAHASVFIQMAQLKKARIDALEESARELDRLHKAKSKALDHLSHELRTPLAIIQGNMRFIKRKLAATATDPAWERWIDAVERNLGRLFEMQKEVDKIVRSDAPSPLPAQAPSPEPPHGSDVTAILRNLVAQQHPERPTFTNQIALHPFLQRIINRARRHSRERDLVFLLEGPKELSVAFDRRVLREIMTGLLKNAIENTPDGGMITTSHEGTDEAVVIRVEDTGIGITEGNQKSIFEGLFHTYETDLYTSKKGYEFGAGGKGLDLFRMKLYEHGFGYALSVESRRCTYIPGDGNLCPGKISACPHCSQPSDCRQAGGSAFFVAIPQHE